MMLETAKAVGKLDIQGIKIHNLYVTQKSRLYKLYYPFKMLERDDKMNVTLIGMGSGQPENLTLQGLAALRQADLILGARRLLAVLPAGCTENRAAAYRPDEVAELLQTSGAENAVLVYSGDTGFYSGASSMMEKLENLGVRARVLPGREHLKRYAIRQLAVWYPQWSCHHQTPSSIKPTSSTPLSDYRPTSQWQIHIGKQ